jgi:ABC-type branched-subunit amino acid transport system ATPase component
MLQVDDLVAGYHEGMDILAGITLEARTGQITAVIGPNGAGKSTLLRTIFGVLCPRRGRILLGGEPIQGLAPHVLKRRGIGFVPQTSSTFPQLTVEENLLLGGWTLRHHGTQISDRIAWVYDLFPAIRSRRHDRATVLSGGQLRMLAIAKEMFVLPRWLLVDEPTAGLAPKIAEEVYTFLKQAPTLGTSVLLVDQNVASAVEIASYVYMVSMGRVQLHGPQEVFARNLRQIIQETLIGV